jgi:hypothetical protein
MSRLAIAAGFIVLAAGMWLASGDKTPPGPAPAPTGLDLRGLFIGPTAADDAVAFGSLCDSLAEAIEYDGTTAAPRLKTGVALDDLRIAAADYRMKGVSIGARQPKVREAIQDYLEAHLGTSGGPVSVEARRAWVDAFRDIARACSDATK